MNETNAQENLQEIICNFVLTLKIESEKFLNLLNKNKYTQTEFNVFNRNLRILPILSISNSQLNLNNKIRIDTKKELQETINNYILILKFESERLLLNHKKTTLDDFENFDENARILKFLTMSNRMLYEKQIGKSVLNENTIFSDRGNEIKQEIYNIIFTLKTESEILLKSSYDNGLMLTQHDTDNFDINANIFHKLSSDLTNMRREQTQKLKNGDN